MCIFTQPVTSVSDTQIFARTTSAGMQYLVYQMHYDSAEASAMILPLPVRLPAREQSLRFIDLEDYDAFFQDLDDGFPFTPPKFSISCSRPLDPSVAALRVFEVGSYIASFVPTLPDFARLDRRFTLPEGVWSKLPQYADYGFAVFQLAEGSLKPHPMALEFESRETSLYFPTLHIHDGEVHEQERFHHVLYMQHAGFDSQVYGYQNSDAVDRSTGLIRSQQLARQFVDPTRAGGTVDGNLLVHRRFVYGMLPNHDIRIATAGDPETPSLNWRPWLSYTPWMVVAAAGAWFLARRGRIARRQRTTDTQPDHRT